ncbi:MAG: 30S ribosomal protein S13 [Candidatus Pacearchaeota archaeon]|nr:30S ribosomal protein S13 [Candidatus Pacearchaeota archaeon]
MDPREKNQDSVGIMRISGTDIPVNMTIYAGLARIKGISWSISNAICTYLKIPKLRKISSLTESEVEKILETVKSAKIKPWLVNRKKDRETGKDRHLIGSELDLQKEFDIRRIKKIRSYKGIRHSQSQPVRGQRTRSHFRKKGPSVGVKRGAKPSSKK